MPSPDTAPAELLSALSRALAALHVPWYLFGAQAAVVWGRPRLTADVDVTVRLDSDDPDTLVSVLEAGGFRLRVSSSDDFVRRTRVLPFVYLPNGLPVDRVMAGPGLEELFLIVTKILAGRPKDLEDIRGVLRQRVGTLNLDVIRSTLAQLEEALGQSDLRPVFEDALSRIHRPDA